MAKKHSQEYIFNYFKENGYVLLGEYKGNKKPLLLQCPKGHITEKLTYDSFRRGNCRCPECKSRHKYLYEEVKENIEKEGYTLLTLKEDYKNVGQKLDIICDKGHKIQMTYGHWLEGKRCKECDKSKKLDYEYVKNEIESIGYKLLSKEYINAKSGLLIECDKGHITNTLTWNNFKRGERCKCCSNSKGEDKINKYLINNNIKFTPQKEFKGLVGLSGGNLRYDFYLPDHNLLIEFQGEQHREFIRGFHNTYSEFEKQLEHDRRKFNYAMAKNIDIIYLYYSQLNEIEEILQYELNYKI